MACGGNIKKNSEEHESLEWRTGDWECEFAERLWILFDCLGVIVPLENFSLMETPSLPVKG